ncbi:MAG: bifunctional phosphoserine phosphatase/homoserine phosphotransferase ThrH [Fibromonadaceae bacterium]|jgi:phosphoserine/homoserine phosphotransferase|nr:bifunctional phosphoserine phosphatase/homoserine phosphotransferase ThrH [Fibromonadaceae bacterium]
MSGSCIVALDLEGVLSPEIWISVAEKTKIDALRLTTRDVSDYDELMQHRLKILDEQGIKLSDIQSVIASLPLLSGAREFLDELREFCQVIILSDTFEEFAKPIMQKLGYPTLFCHNLEIENDKIIGYKLRQKNQKQHAVEALKSLNFRIFAAGDSYNDITMLKAAAKACLFCAPDSVKKEFPQFKATESYGELMREIKDFFQTRS